MEHRIAEGAAELSRVFPYVESEVLEGLLESMEGALTEDLLQQIEELEIEATGSNIRPKLVLLKRDGPKSLIVSSKGRSKMPVPVTPGCILIFVDPDVPEDDGESGGSAMGCPPCGVSPFQAPVKPPSLSHTTVSSYLRQEFTTFKGYLPTAPNSIS